ncbi:MAG TPA: SusC/RagA family TonB-linked outer membrane protein [Candidatus Butyricimonas faecavium]|nr:SusC/RagA family TonB-linked outer membrane protein [Candidatus Butyricimonas faecavium]
MKKNLYACVDRYRKVMKLILMMKATFILSVLFALQVHAGAYSQQVRLSMELEKASIKQIINEIKLHTEYSFVYSDADLSGIQDRDVLFKDATIESILSSCLKGTGLKFSIEENTIVIWKEGKRSMGKVEEKIVKGIVTDKQGVPLPGTTVMVKGTTLGVVSDTAGHFQISLPENGEHVLVFSFVGMKIQEISVADKAFVRVVLEEDSEALEDVVVTGYGKRSKSSYAGAVQTMKSEDLVATGATNLIESLKGLVPGVEVRSSGLVGGSPTIKIRGCNRLEESTITGTAAPLFVLDGFIMNDMSCYDMLNPKDIESITILKDAEAMALYGSRGANGVIVVQRKKGKDQKMQWKLDVSHGFVALGMDDFDFMSPKETLEWERLLYKNYTAEHWEEPSEEQILKFRPDSMLEHTTDWFKEALGGSGTTDVSLGLVGGNERTQFFVQGSYTHRAGIIKKNDQNRFGLVANLQHKASDKVSVGLNTSAYRMETKKSSTANTLYNALPKMSPLLSAYDPETGELLDGTQEGFSKSLGNPLYDYKLNDDNTISYIFSAGLTADIQLLPFLNWNTQVGYEVSNSINTYYRDPRTNRSSSVVGDKGSLTESHSLANSVSWRSMLGVNKFWDNHSITGFISVEGSYEDSDYTHLSGTFKDPLMVKNLASMSNVKPTKSMEKSNFMGVVVQAEYGYQGKYYVSGSIRTDGSSRFGGNNKWGTFGSVGIAYNMKNEKFLDDLGWIDILKWRATYGRVGNANFGSSYSHYTVYENAQFAYADKYPAYAMNNYKNENLKWETTDVYNVGVDFGFLGDRVSGSVDYYYKKTTGLLESLYLPLSSGLTSQMQNTAGVENQGMEIFIQSQNIRKAFRWSTNFNISFNRNKVLSLRNGVDEIEDFTFYAKVGKTMECYFVPEWAGVNPDTGGPQWYDENGELTDDYYSARKIFLSREDRYRGGFNNFFSWKGINLGINIFFANVRMMDRFGMSYSDTDGANFGGVYVRDAAKNYWQKPGDQVARPKPMRYGNNSANESSSRYYIQGFFARLQSVNLSYDFPEKWMGKFLKQATVFFRGNNLGYIYTDNSMLDPDSKSGMISLLTGGASVPNGRNFSFGINLTF